MPVAGMSKNHTKLTFMFNPQCPVSSCTFRIRATAGGAVLGQSHRYCW